MTVQDIRHAVRFLRSWRLGAAVAVATLAIGISTTTSLYVFLGAVLGTARPHIEDIDHIGRIYAGDPARSQADRCGDRNRRPWNSRRHSRRFRRARRGQRPGRATLGGRCRAVRRLCCSGNEPLPRTGSSDWTPGPCYGSRRQPRQSGDALIDGSLHRLPRVPSESCLEQAGDRISQSRQDGPGS